MKTHGHTTGAGAHVAREKQLEYNHHSEVNHTAILLIRNPYKAIIGKNIFNKKHHKVQNMYILHFYESCLS